MYSEAPTSSVFVAAVVGAEVAGAAVAGTVVGNARGVGLGGTVVGAGVDAGAQAVASMANRSAKDRGMVRFNCFIWAS